MNSNSHKSSSKVQPEAVPGAVEATLRLIAALPAPMALRTVSLPV